MIDCPRANTGIITAMSDGRGSIPRFIILHEHISLMVRIKQPQVDRFGWFIGMSEGLFDAVLVVSFGGPERPDDVLPFLENVLRGRDVPARIASVYAPGLSPMDFHAVAEALVEGLGEKGYGKYL